MKARGRSRHAGRGDRHPGPQDDLGEPAAAVIVFGHAAVGLVGVAGHDDTGRSAAEAVPCDLSRRCRVRRSGAWVRPRGLGPQPFGMIARGDQEHGGGVGTNAIKGEQARGTGRDEGHDELAEAIELAVQKLGAATEFP
jgi:hypothetical protein